MEEDVVFRCLNSHHVIYYNKLLIYLHMKNSIDIIIYRKITSETDFYKLLTDKSIIKKKILLLFTNIDHKLKFLSLLEPYITNRRGDVIFLTHIFNISLECIQLRKDYSVLNLIKKMNLDINLYLNIYNNLFVNEMLVRNLKDIDYTYFLSKTKNLLQSNIYNKNIIYLSVIYDKIDLFCTLYTYFVLKNHFLSAAFNILDYCFKYKRLNFIKYLLSLNSLIVNKYNQDVLILCVKYNDIKFLLSILDTNKVCRDNYVRDDHQKTFLTYLLEKKNNDIIINTVLKKLKRFDFGNFWCICDSRESFIVIRWIFYSINWNSSLLKEKNEEGESILIYYILQDNLKLFKLIMDLNVIDIMDTDQHGNNGFYIAILLGSYDICKYILQCKYKNIDNIYMYLKIVYLLNYDDLFQLMLKYLKIKDYKKIILKKKYNLKLYNEYSRYTKKLFEIEYLKFLLWEIKKKKIQKIFKNYLSIDLITYIISFMSLSSKITKF